MIRSQSSPCSSPPRVGRRQVPTLGVPAGASGRSANRGPTCSKLHAIEVRKVYTGVAGMLGPSGQKNFGAHVEGPPDERDRLTAPGGEGRPGPAATRPGVGGQIGAR